MNEVQKYNCLLKTRQGEVLKSWYQKELFTLNMLPENKQNKIRQGKKDETKEKSYLNYTARIRY